MVIGCPYSDQLREAASWLGVAMVTGLTVYGVYQIATCSKAILNPVRSRVHRSAKIPGNLIRAVNTSWMRIRSGEKSEACNLRLPPDISFAKEVFEHVERVVLDGGDRLH